MKKLLSCIFLIMSLSGLLMGCDHGGIARDAIDTAERLMESHPDSAYLILDTIDRKNLHTDRDRARFALLLTQSMDKCHLDPSDDSLISVAVDYYSGTEDFLRQAMANYYQGRVRYHISNYPTALLSFFKARELSERYDMDLWAGMASRGISDIYDNAFNHEEALFYARDEYEFIKRTGKQPYLNFALCDLSRALCNAGMADESIAICTQLLDSADKYDDSYLRYSALYYYVWNLTKTHRYDEAYPYAREICTMEFADSSDSLDLCNILYEMGEIGLCHQLLNQVSSTDTMKKSLIEYKIAKCEHDYRKALERSEFFQMEADSLLGLAISNNLTSTLTGHLKSELRMEEMENDRRRLHSLLVVYLLIGSLFIVCFLFIQYRKRQQREVSEKVLLAEQVQETIQRLEREKSHVLDNVRSLLSSKYGVVEELSYIIYRNSDSNAARRQIADSVEAIIDGMSIGGNRIKDLEQEVNNLYDNIYSDFRTDLPNLKESDYRLFLFSVVGFSSAVIALFLKEKKVEAVYNRKRKLKQKIGMLDEKKIVRYLSML